MIKQDDVQDTLHCRHTYLALLAHSFIPTQQCLLEGFPAFLKCGGNSGIYFTDLNINTRFYSPSPHCHADRHTSGPADIDWWDSSVEDGGFFLLRALEFRGQLCHFKPTVCTLRAHPLHQTLLGTRGGISFPQHVLGTFGECSNTNYTSLLTFTKHAALF